MPAAASRSRHIPCFTSITSRTPLLEAPYRQLVLRARCCFLRSPAHGYSGIGPEHTLRADNQLVEIDHFNSTYHLGQSTAEQLTAVFAKIDLARARL